MKETLRLTGTFRRKGDIWWALCNEFPIAAPGRTQDEAVSAAAAMVRAYVAASGAALEEREGDQFDLSLAAVG